MCVTYTYIYIFFIYALLRVRIFLETHKNPQFVDNFPNKFPELSKIKQLPRYHTESDNSITIANGTMQPPWSPFCLLFHVSTPILAPMKGKSGRSNHAPFAGSI